ncbi:hypothetical protein GCM10023096_87090 [Nonomuraea ferruginea]
MDVPAAGQESPCQGGAHLGGGRLDDARHLRDELLHGRLTRVFWKEANCQPSGVRTAV